MVPIIEEKAKLRYHIKIKKTKTKEMRKFLSKIGIIIVSFLFILSANSYAQESYYPPLEAYGLNTIAGYETYLRTSMTAPESNVVFEVRNPNNELVTLSAVASGNGVAQTKLSDYHTEVAGIYTVSARSEGGISNGRVNTFIVYSGEISNTMSSISPSEQVVRSYDDSAQIKVKLLDNFNNPIEGHAVKLISSNGSENSSIKSNSNFTDQNGEIVFTVSSSSNGPVTYSAYDVTADVTLSSRAKVAYFDSGEYIFSNDIPMDYSYAAFGNGSYTVDRLEFEDVPETINVGESVNFTLTAYDPTDLVEENYTGTVRFVVTGDNAPYANLPDDYSFTSQDLGTHTFSLALSFLQPGTYEMTVVDIDDPSILGEYSFEVTETGVTPPTSTISISNPISGTYSNNVQVISGNTTPGAKLRIYDNDIEIASLVADAAGIFTYTTGVLVDGAHIIYVASVNDVGTIIDTSPSVELIIDTSAPEITQVIFDPSDTVDPGSVVSVRLYTEEQLSQASVSIEGNIYDFTYNPDGFHETSFAAPIEFGQYPLSFILVDQLGNESRVDNAATLTVGVVTTPPPVDVVGDVTGLSAAADDHRVTLAWLAPSVSATPIKNYRVYYGLSPNELTQAVDTFTDSTTWYIPNLKNGVQYYFAVVAVDNRGNISEHFSNIVSATPNPGVIVPVSPDVALGFAGGEALDEMEKDVSEAGPEVVWLVLFALIGGIFYSKSSKKRQLIKEKNSDLFK